MRKINTIETEIAGLRTTETGRKALDSLIEHFQVEDELHETRHSEIIEEIYIRRTYGVCWKLANIFYVSENALLRYRKLYIKCFYIYYNAIKTENEGEARRDEGERSNIKSYFGIEKDVGGNKGNG